MQGVELLPAEGALPEEVVGRWVAAALTEAAALRDLDDHLYTADDDPAKLERAAGRSPRRAKLSHDPPARRRGLRGFPTVLRRSRCCHANPTFARFLILHDFRAGFPRCCAASAVLLAQERVVQTYPLEPLAAGL